MARILGWILLLAAFSAAILWLSDHPGQVTIVWLGYEIRIQVAILIAAASIVLLLLLPFLSFLRSLLGLPSLLRGHGRDSRHKKGMQALTQALTALAASDVDTAARNTRKMSEYLGEGPLTALLSAQIAHRREDTEGTRKHLKDMLAYGETKFIAARALSGFARAEGNYTAAIAFARDALKIEPKSLWGHRTLVDAYIRQERWQEAEQTVRQARSKRRITPRDAQHLLALNYHAQALLAQNQHHPEAALRAAQEAYHLEPGFLPNCILLCRLLGDKGNRRKALAVLSRGFKAQPHPALSDALIALCHDEPAGKLQKRAREIAASHPNHPESQLMQARVAIHLGQWDTARSHIKTALTQAERAQAYRMLATIETSQYDNRTSAAEWLARASEAAPDPLWVCEECGHQHKQWQHHCAHCDSFDTLTWKTPSEHFERRPTTFLLEHS